MRRTGEGLTHSPLDRVWQLNAFNFCPTLTFHYVEKQLRVCLAVACGTELFGLAT